MIDWLACKLVRAISVLLCRVPPGAAVWCGERFGLLAYWLQPKRTQIGLANLRAAFDGQLTPQRARRIIRACYKQLGAGVTEMLRLPVIDEAYVTRYVTIEGMRHFKQAVTSGRPVIFLTAHYGNWELSSIVAALIGHPIVALARAQNTLPRLYRLLVSYRESKGCTVVHKGGAMKRLIEALEARRLIGIVGDQVSRQGLFVDFFGRPALFATGPFELAREKQALIVPAFMHRLRGPFHRLVIEPPLTRSHPHEKVEAIRDGIEQFAVLLSRHMREEPSQWLWMHKRWKHTPARRILVLSDGKRGHLKQSLAVVEAMRERHPSVTHHVIDVRYRSRLARGVALLWSWWMPARFGAERCLRWTVTAEASSSLLSRYADLVVSCGSSLVPANLLLAAARRAKSIVIMNPAPLPLERFSLVIAPRHDRLPARRNVVHITGAISQLTEEDLLKARDRLHTHPNFRSDLRRAGQGRATPASAQHKPSGATATSHQPTIGVFIGGDTFHYELSAAFADALTAQIIAACDALDGVCLVTTSRRTSSTVERLLAERLSQFPRCRLLLLASRDFLDGTMEGMLGSADLAVVTGESISMVSEACASGRHVIVVEPPLRRAEPSTRTKHQRFLRDLVKDGYVHLVSVPELGLTIQRALKERQSAKRLDNLVKVRDAVARLL